MSVHSRLDRIWYEGAMGEAALVPFSWLYGRVVAARWIPVTLEGGIPHLAAGGGDAPLVASLSLQDFPNSHFDIGADGVFAPTSGRGTAGATVDGDSG